MIKAPFNFVPLSEKVFFPSWASQVNHDIPFSDGESGVIDVTITAKSPIFIRDGKHKEEFCHFVKPNGEKQYYIPGSSFKGMIRNVLEIMSFSKMSEIDDSTYSIRDLRNRELYMGNMRPSNINCGWLKKDGNGEYIIEDCETPGRIKHEEIENILGINYFAKKFKKCQGRNDRNCFDNKENSKSAKYKYELLDRLGISLAELMKVRSFDSYPHKTGKLIAINGTNKQGQIVLTGQPSGRDEYATDKNGNPHPIGKIYEFVFFDKKNEIKISKKVMNNFLFAYFDGRKTQPKESTDWKFWKKELNKEGGRIPVFFQKNGDEIKHFGLSYLYKLPYDNSVKQGLPESHHSNLDLAQLIFGYIESKDNSSLKGRVQFSNLKALESASTLPLKKEILGGPKASYYPIYIEQNGNGYNTYMKEGFKLSGWKRYPIHKEGVQETINTLNNTINDDVKTKFKPLKEGVVFSGKIRFHNLKKAEIGALLSSLTFHNTQNTFHNIGMAKALGYGKIKLDIKLKNLELEKKDYLKRFEVQMLSNFNYENKWYDSPQIKELFSMATEQNNEGGSELKYMELQEFAKNKNKNRDGSRNYLKKYSYLDNINITLPQSLVNNNDIDEYREKIKFEKDRALELKIVNDFKKMLNDGELSKDDVFNKWQDIDSLKNDKKIAQKIFDFGLIDTRINKKKNDFKYEFKILAEILDTTPEKLLGKSKPDNNPTETTSSESINTDEIRNNLRKSVLTLKEKNKLSKKESKKLDKLIKKVKKEFPDLINELNI